MQASDFQKMQEMTETTGGQTIGQSLSETMSQPTLAVDLEYLTDHSQKQENSKDCPTLSWQGSAVAFPCVLLDQIGQYVYCKQLKQGQFFAQ